MKKKASKKGNNVRGKKQGTDLKKTAAQKKWAEICKGLDDHPWLPAL